MRFFVLCLALLFAPAFVLPQSNPEALYHDGLESYNQGRFEEAVELLEKATALAPDIPDYRMSLGLAYLKTGRAKEAARELEAVRGMIGIRKETRDKEPEVLVHMATAYIQIGKLDTARKRLDLALKRNPELVEARYSLGLIEQKEGNPEKARAQFEAVLMADPGHTQANLAVGKWLQEQGRGAEAYEKLLQAARGIPADYEIVMAFAAVAFEQGKLDEAREAYRFAKVLDPES
jgi:Flp pilus assembly protein TadD